VWDGFNKRKFPRLHLTCEVVVRPQGKELAIKTTTENVGMGGICVMLEQPLERFDRCKVVLELKDGEPPVQCSGRSVWIVPHRDIKTSRTLYDTGIEFLDIDDFSRQRLQAFLVQPKKG
jgi:c-di-GMP-binding flagellar brake protein YcgR